MLIALREALQARRLASLDELAGTLGVPAATVEALLAHWQRKGRIAVEPAPCQGGSCGGCSARACHYYRWLDTPAAPFIAIRSDSSPPPA
ncbi:FeoC-like transcriptional regulator [Laribacter hongkongensis]|jgi:hypothetical protein|uniref:Transcriptional regulator HTH-type FeoC domain-containing protein n=4 Tax=Laribacter hongkongensis TaxID=168471 RepID=C1D5K7_LARHH|nr:FeoC-like transcriptional regulator [Laribacter hongkongensis]ACO76024.1 hypothetical protein LHK_03046 [Laribacter hongkongensis HLHK9]MBE5529648.1 hypothetical protein [Laribacter hongkongensis]MCG8992221.1 FeoC-like transcriptional regulator [Laribacter hongkongensis]MCG8996297.1 FeoC-like transcriptional regulator [Laribacter hongkongensis]MCG8999511.1 FeoC-like transcriptional regulator [Laribacter hongkongensis]